MAPVKVEVTGHSKIFSPAEVAVLSVEVRHESTDKDSVVTSVVDSSAKLQNILEEYSNHVAGAQAIDGKHIEWTNSSLSTGSYLYWGNNQDSERKYNANMNYQVSFKDFSILGDFSGMILGMPFVEIGDLKWELSEATTNKVETQSRHEAIKDALKKANDYADAVGITGLTVTSIKDVLEPQGHAIAFGMRGAAAGGGGPMVKFNPEQVSTECRVTVVLETQ